jgi:hypothetical protein
MTQEWLNERLVREHVAELGRQMTPRRRRSLRNPGLRRYSA